MQISPPNPALIPSLGNAAGADDPAGRTKRNATAETAAPRAEAPAGADVERKLSTIETVSPVAEVQARASADTPVPVYAEIWKGSLKLAQIDIHGHVTSFSGLVVAQNGASGGAVVAAQRAVQLAQLTGGEIRAAGQALDGNTLLMRARLANTYRP